MIITGTRLKVVDNTGVVEVCCFAVIKGKAATIGDTIVVSVKATKRVLKTSTKSISLGSVQLAVVTGIKGRYVQKDGTSIRFDQNSAALLVAKSKTAKKSVNKGTLGNRIMMPVVEELRSSKHKKLYTLGAGSI